MGVGAIQGPSLLTQVLCVVIEVIDRLDTACCSAPHHVCPCRLFMDEVRFLETVWTLLQSSERSLK